MASRRRAGRLGQKHRAPLKNRPHRPIHPAGSVQQEDPAVGRRERDGEIRRLSLRNRGHRSAVALASAPRPAETTLWFDPSLRTAAELLAERAAGAEERHVA